MSMLHFIKARRVEINGKKPAIRMVYRSQVIEHNNGIDFDSYVADKAPLFYRRMDDIINDLRDGLFLTAFKSTLARAPTAQSFQESHFGEIVAGLFAEEVLGLRRLYSKLTNLSAENSNAYKMDLVMYQPNATPIKFILGEVKCSPKSGKPADHHKSCYPDLFNSLREYSQDDYNFDIAAARDNLSNIPDSERESVRAALLPYSGAEISYAGFVVVDSATYCETEAQILRTRSSNKEFEVDLICVESFSKVASSVYQGLQALLEK